MGLRFQRLIDRRAWIFLFALVLVCRIAFAGDNDGSDVTTAGNANDPVGERLTYAISWMGIHCGEMEITSFVDNSIPDAPINRIVGLARTTRFFDGIYRLRSRLDSHFDPHLMTSIRFEEHSIEKKKRKDEVWLVDTQANEVLWTKNGETTIVPVEVDRAYDPLAFIARLRTMKTEVGEETMLGLMTSDGVVEIVARATKVKTIKTKMGKVDAVAVIPEPGDETKLKKSGSLVVWIDRVEPHRPCKIEFDLAFGKLVASLRTAETVPVGNVGEDWEHWGESKEETR